MIDLRRKSRAVSSRLLSAPGLTDLAVASPAATAALGSPAAAASRARLWEPEEHRLWQEGWRRLRPASATLHLRRAACTLTEGGKRGAADAPRPRSLSLVLAAPEMDASAAELHLMLQAADAEGLFAAISVPQGLLRLDGHLADRLTQCNTRAAMLPPALQVSSQAIASITHAAFLRVERTPQLATPSACTCLPAAAVQRRASYFLPPSPSQAPASYPRLQRLALKLLPDDDPEAFLGCINTQTLPALRCLALLAPSGAAAAADLHPLRHAALTRLDLHGVQLPAGFPSLLNLTGVPRAHHDAARWLTAQAAVPAAAPAGCAPPRRPVATTPALAPCCILLPIPPCRFVFPTTCVLL